MSVKIFVFGSNIENWEVKRKITVVLIQTLTFTSSLVAAVNHLMHDTEHILNSDVWAASFTVALAPEEYKWFKNPGSKRHEIHRSINSLRWCRSRAEVKTSSSTFSYPGPAVLFLAPSSGSQSVLLGYYADLNVTQEKKMLCWRITWNLRCLCCNTRVEGRI